MPLYLNNDTQDLKHYYGDLFVDKSGALKVFNQILETREHFVCVSKPHCFGKTHMAALINAYYSKGSNTKAFFDDLEISKEKNYLKHLNKHNVLWLNIYSEIYSKSSKLELKGLVSYLTNRILKELESKYHITFISQNLSDALKTLYYKKGEKFIIIIDDYDVPYRKFYSQTKDLSEYMNFLESLINTKDASLFTELVYLTGVLPMKKVSAKPLPNLREYMQLHSYELTPYYGFTLDELKDICQRNNLPYEDCLKLYDGYEIDGVRVVNPYSIVHANTHDNLSFYWLRTACPGVVTELAERFSKLCDILIQILNHEYYKSIKLSSFCNDPNTITNYQQALTYMIYLGYLSINFKTHQIYIPSLEARAALENAIFACSKGRFSKIIPLSKELLWNTKMVNPDPSYLAKILGAFHKEYVSEHDYSKPSSLEKVLTYAYFACNYSSDYDKPIFSLESKNGVATLILHSKHTHEYDQSRNPSMIIELKSCHTKDSLMNRIKRGEEHYPAILQDYTGYFLFVEYLFDEDTKVHTCVIDGRLKKLS